MFDLYTCFMHVCTHGDLKIYWERDPSEKSLTFLPSFNSVNFLRYGCS